jgi:hypothetical protein
VAATSPKAVVRPARDEGVARLPPPAAAVSARPAVTSPASASPDRSRSLVAGCGRGRALGRDGAPPDRGRKHRRDGARAGDAGRRRSPSSKAAGETHWRLRVERENLRAPALREKLQAAVAEALRMPVRLELEAGVAVDTPAERAAEARRQRQARAEQEIHDDPLVKALLAQYKTARIVPGSVKPL